MVLKKIAVFSIILVMLSITPATALPVEIFNDTISLPHGAFTFVPGNDLTASYAWKNATDLGALTVASTKGGFDFEALDTYYELYGSFFLESINGTINEPWNPGISKSWSIYINGNPAPLGLGLNRLGDKDVVSFYFCPTNATTWQPEIDNASYTVNITVEIPEPVTIFDGDVVLHTHGTFMFSPTNNPGGSYEVRNSSDLGLLIAAAETGGFAFESNDEWYAAYGSFLLESIDGIANEDWMTPNYKSWVIFINGEIAPLGLGLNEIENGDVATLCYCPSDPVTYEYYTDEATYIINISAETRIIWTGDVTLPYGTFDFIPSNDPGSQYEIPNFTALGALDTASENAVFSYEASDEFYDSYGTFFLESIAGIKNEDWTIPDYKSWSIYINGAAAPAGLGSNLLEDGDVVNLYYCPIDKDFNPITGAATSVVTLNIHIPVFSSWTGNASLAEGTFNFVPSNDPAASYDISWGTDLGVLKAAALKCGFDFNVSDSWYDSYGSFLLEGLGGVENEPWPGDIWYIHINGNPAPQGLGLNTVTSGDHVVFYYGPYDDPAHSTHMLDITVSEAPQFQSPGASDDDAPEKSSIKWSVELPESPDFAPVVSEGRVYVATWPDMDFSDGDEMYLYCLDEQTGAEIWKNPLGIGYGSVSGGIIAFGNIYCGGTEGYLYSINTSTGSTVWKKEIYSGLSGFGVSSKPLIYDSLLYVNSADGTLYALDPITGNEDWRFTSGGNFTAWGGTYFTSPSRAGDTIIYAADENEVYCIDTLTNAEVWNFTTIGTIQSTPVVGSTMTYLTTTEKIYALNTANGVKIAENDISANQGTPVLSGTALYLGTDDGLSRYDANSLAEAWHFPSAPVSVSPSLADDTIFFATNEEAGTVYALNADTGDEVWHYTLPSPGGGNWASFWGSSPAISGGVLFIGAENNHFYAFGEGTSQPSPKPIPSGGDDGDDSVVPSYQWQTITLNPGVFELTAEDTGDAYKVKRQTPLGILNAAGIEFTISNEWWDGYGSLFITSVNGHHNDVQSGWMYQVNSVTPGVGANTYPLEDGDKVVFYWSESMASSPETSDEVFYLKARIETPDSPDNGGTDSKDNETSGEWQNDTCEHYLLGLPEGATLTLANWGEYFSIDMDAAISAGENIGQNGNTISFTRNNITMNIRLEDFKDRENVISGFIEKIWIVSEPAILEIPSIGMVTASFETELYTLPVDALIKGTFTDVVSEDMNQILMRASIQEGYQLEDIAYVFTIDSGTLEDGIDIGSASLTMTVSKDWIDSHGGIDAVRIAHLKDDGSTEMLEISFEAEDDDGSVIISAVSPDGLSSFAMIAVTEKIEGPDVAVEMEQKQVGEQNSEKGATSLPLSLALLTSGDYVIGIVCALIVVMLVVLIWRRQ